MGFTDEERIKIYYHLGYLGVAQVETFHLGVPAALQTTFMIEGAIPKLLPAAEPIARKLICRLDLLETQLYEGSDLVDVVKTGNVEINQKRFNMLARYYCQAMTSLAGLFGVVCNPFDARVWVHAGMGGINVGVR